MSKGQVTVPVVARPNVRLLKGRMSSTMAGNRVRCRTVHTLGRYFPRSTTYAAVVSLAIRTRTFKTQLDVSPGRMPDIYKHLLAKCTSIRTLRVPSIRSKHVPRCLLTSHLTTRKVSGPILTNYVNPCSLTNHLCSVARVVVTVCARPSAILLLLRGYARFVLHCYLTVGRAKITNIVVTRPTTKLLSGRSYRHCSSICIGHVVSTIRSSSFTIVLRGYNGAKRYATTVLTANTGKCRFKGGTSVVATLQRYPSSM